MARTREEAREYMRTVNAYNRKKAAENGGAIDSPVSGEEISDPPVRASWPLTGPTSAAVRLQLQRVPAEILETIPVLAATMHAAAAVIDRREDPHLHTAAIRELRASLEKLEAIAPGVKPVSKMDELRARRSGA